MPATNKSIERQWGWTGNFCAVVRNSTSVIGWTAPQLKFCLISVSQPVVGIPGQADSAPNPPPTVNAPTLAGMGIEHSNSLRILYICCMTLDSTKIESIKEYFKTRPVLKAYLFGSYVRGSADTKSDIDILVDLDYSQRIGLQFIQMKLDLEKLLNNKVDLVSSNGMSKYIKPLVDGEKHLIYAK